MKYFLVSNLISFSNETKTKNVKAHLIHEKSSLRESQTIRKNEINKMSKKKLVNRKENSHKSLRNVVRYRISIQMLNKLTHYEYEK